MGGDYWQHTERKELLLWLTGTGGESRHHHVPEDTTEGDGAGRGALCGTQPYPSDRDAGRARGCPSVPLYREAGLAGRRTAKSTSPQSLQALQPTGALSPGGDAAADRGLRHDWLQGRGPYLTLVGAVDDATGKVPFALSDSRKMPTATC